MILRTEHLTKEYGSFRALDDLNLTINQGEVFGLLGPNGSGKTTALRLAMGFLQPSAGACWIDGHNCWEDSVAARAKVAYLPGELRLYENLTGRELVSFLCRLRRTGSRGVDELAKRFDIDLDRPLAQLSSGMKRKVALLQVLVPHVPLLILDEPTNTLDPTMREELLHQIKLAKSEGQTVLFSSHVLSEVEQVCDRVCILHKGKLAHLQDMCELREGRLITARFKDGTGITADLPGLQECSRQGKQISWEYTGELSPLFAWLAKLDLQELRLEPLGLTGIYQRFHGAPE